MRLSFIPLSFGRTVSNTTRSLTPHSSRTRFICSAVSTQRAESPDALLRRKGYRPGDNVIMFDGVCVMCNAGVDFVMRHDTRSHFKFAALQSETGKALAKKFACPSDLSTMIYIEGDKAFVRSDAALRIGRQLGWYFSLPAQLALWTVPKVLRDFLYTDVIANNRYSAFGKKDECRFVQPGEEHRFLN